MEIDIEVCLSGISRIIALDIAKYFPVEYPQEGARIAHLNVIIRPAMNPQIVSDVDIEIRNFLQGLTVYAEAIKQSQGTLRIGIFYNLCETVVFPFRLSIETIKLLCELNLSVDATGYPCADEIVE